MSQIPSTMNVIPLGGQNNQPNYPSKKNHIFAYKHWIIWILGLLVSFLPLIAVCLNNFITMQGYTNFWFDILGNRDVFYICVTLAITAILDWLARLDGTDKVGFSTIIPVFCLVLGAALCMALYIIYEIKGGEIQTNLIYVTAFFIFFTLVCGSILFFDVQTR